MKARKILSSLVVAVLISQASCTVVLADDAATGSTILGSVLLNRLGPTKSDLYTANADGTGETALFATSQMDYHAAFSADGQWIVFTSERDGRGNSELYRVNVNG